MPITASGLDMISMFHLGLVVCSQTTLPVDEQKTPDPLGFHRNEQKEELVNQREEIT